MKFLEYIKSNKLKSGLIGFGILLSLMIIMLSSKKVSPISWGWHGTYENTSGVAIGGFDPVNYHTSNSAKMGAETIKFNWENTEWHFASEENKALFQSDPKKYAPQFGGFCSFAVSTGFTASTDPNEWNIKDGKLYLFNGSGPKTDWEAASDSGIIQDGVTAWSNR